MITTGEKVIRLSEAHPGDLIRIAIHENSLYAIVMGQEKRHTILASLQPLQERSNYPFHFAPANERRAISYGSDWYIETLPGPEFSVGSSALRWASGALRLQDDGWILAIHPLPTDHEHSEIYYNLSSNEMTGRPHPEDSAPIGRWRIWRSELAYSTDSEEALVAIEAIDMG